MIAILLLLLSLPAGAQATTVTLSFQGETNLRTDFIQQLKREGTELGLTIQVVERSNTAREFEVILAQESSMGGAAAAAIVLDRDGVVVTSVVRSGRLSAKGSMNACAKEIAKKLAVLRK
jgi:hypothetical protein